MIGVEIHLVVSDPFDLAGREYSGVIVDEDAPAPRRVLVAMTAPGDFRGVKYSYVVLAARRGNSLSLSGRLAEEVTAIGLHAPPHSSESGWGADKWRGGGLAFQASLTGQLHSRDE